MSTDKYTYGTTGKPYQLTGIETSTGLVSDVEQTVVYTSFEQPSSITESPYQALFTYNADGERAKMEVKQSGATIKTRWYAGSRYLKETAGGVTKEFTWIGGDAYTAPCLALTQSGTTTYYYLLRDHLGTITHVTDASGNVVNEYNFDAWGRRRNFTDWSYTVAAQTDILPDRGFTGHEYLPWFKLFNMNGRLYDPVVGRFLEPDPVVQDASSTQNLNRYSYCLNNPLKYTDPSGYRKRRLEPGPGEERIIYYEPDYRGRDYNGGFSYRRDNMWSINSMINELSASAYGGSWSSQYGYQTFNSPVVPGLTYTEYTEITVMLLGRGNWNEDRTSLAFSASGNVLIYGVDFKYSVGWSYDGAPIGGGSSFDDAFEPGIGAVGTYYSVKGNALHNDLYWKGKTTGKIYAKNPFVKNKIGWKANSFKATGKVFQGAKSLGSKFGAAGLLLTGYDIVFGNGMTTSNMLDAAFGAAGFIPGVGWAISGSYFLINTGVQLYSGKSIGEHWDE